MKNSRIIVCTIIGLFLQSGCGLPPVCQSYSPYELDWNGYNSVSTFKKYFSGYEQTILSHIGDTVRVYGCLNFKVYGTPVPEIPEDNRYLLKSFFDDSGNGHGQLMFIENDAEIEIPLSFYDKTLYVTGTVIYYDDMGCQKGTGLQLINIDTIP